MSRDHYKGVPKTRAAVVDSAGNLRPLNKLHPDPAEQVGSADGFAANGDVVPTASGTYDLGTSDARWDNLYVDGVVSAETRTYHEPIATASTLGFFSGTQPATIIIDTTTIALSFDVGADAAYRTFKIPSNYAGNASFHVHWTKTVDTDQSGNAAKWQVSYSVHNGYNDDLTATPSVVSSEDTYDDSGTTTRIVRRTPNMPADAFEAGHYVSLKVEAITPTGSALSGPPALITVDLIFDQFIHS